MDLTGSNNPNWKGGKRKNGDYVMRYIKNHPFKTKARYVMEHRLIMEQHLRDTNCNHSALIEINGVKYLSLDWVVHHKNRKKDDNRIENLEVMIKVEHDRFESTGRKKSDEAKKKMSLAKIGEKNPNFGKPGTFLERHHTEKTKKKMSLLKEGKYISKNNPFYRKHHSIENKLRLSKLHKKLPKNRDEQGRYCKKRNQ